MLRGENGEQRKEFHKLVSWLRSEPPPDVVSLPNSLLIALARPIKEALGRPVCCTLQGEDLFLEGLGEPWRTQALDLIRAQVESVDAFVAVSDYYAGFMSRYLAIPESKMHVVPLGINLKGYDTGFRFRTNCFTVGYFARIVPEKGLHVLCEAYRKLRRETDFSGATLEAAGLPGSRTSRLSARRRTADEAVGPGRRVPLPRRARPRAQDRLPAQPQRALRAGQLRRAQGHLLARGHGQRSAGGPAAARRVSGNDREDRRRHPGGTEQRGQPGRRNLLACGAIQARADELGRRGAAGVREHYSAARMAQRAVEVYGEVGARACSLGGD